ncbi:MAG: hypothetical protein C4B56_00340 [Candidatus Methanophagaceae archaeon]|nr:MAG: hypothetical protein C4B56_00340 [Methanophagales archaeon]
MRVVRATSTSTSIALITGIIITFIFISLVPVCAYSSLLITEVYPKTMVKGEPDEYIVLINNCAHSVDIANWSITDNEAKFTFPHVSIPPGREIYLARKTAVYARPDADVIVATLKLKPGTAFALRDRGDEVILRDNHGRVADVLIYGDSPYNGPGWRGEPLKKPLSGMVFHRKAYEDTDTASDWVILPPGASYHPPELISVTNTSVTTFVSPDCSFTALKSELDNASSSLYLNLYEFDNNKLLEPILDALHRGVRVYLLLEGRPVGGMEDEERYIAEQIASNGGTVRFAHDRFLNHAKYAIIDDKTLILMSENWKYTGVPYDRTYGNRGWGIVIRNREIAHYFMDLFLDDLQRAKADTNTETDASLSRGMGIGMKMNSKSQMEKEIPAGGYYTPVFKPHTMTTNFTVIPVLAPDSALSSGTILDMIRNAKRYIHVELFSAAMYWGDEPNPFISALVEASRRGCDVKILLDSKYLENDNNNDEVVSALNRIARSSNLSLEAKLADLDSLGLAKVHNKGLVVDGKKVLITSLNWNAHSIYNREAGVIIDNSAIASFYDRVFLYDWNACSSTNEHEHARERTPEMQVLYIILTLCASFLIFQLVRWYQRRWR